MKVFKAEELIRPQSELFKLLRFFPKPDENGPWIAGGSVWKSIEGESLGEADVDVFFASAQQFEVYYRILRSIPHCGRLLSEKQNSFNLTFNYRVYQKDFTKIFPIQLIHFKTFSNVEELLNGFDFTACQFAYDGKHIFTGDNSIDHLRERKIVFNSIRDPLATSIHLKKYTSKGFTISAEEQKKFDDFCAEAKSKPKDPSSKAKITWRNYYEVGDPRPASRPIFEDDLVDSEPYRITENDIDTIVRELEAEIAQEAPASHEVRA